MNRYGTDRSVLVPTVMLERWADELVELRRVAGGSLPAGDARVLSLIRELRMLSDIDFRREATT